MFAGVEETCGKRLTFCLHKLRPATLRIFIIPILSQSEATHAKMDIVTCRDDREEKRKLQLSGDSTTGDGVLPLDLRMGWRLH